MKFDFTIEDGVLKRYNAPILDCDAVATVPDGVTEIAASAFYYIRGLDGVELSESVTKIGEEAFYMCEGMTWIKMPSHLDVLGARAFAHCHSLEKIVIPEGVSVIHENTFYKCERLQEVYLPRSIRRIEPGAFYGAYLLSNLFYAGTKTEWEQNVKGGLSTVVHLGFDEANRDKVNPYDFEIKSGVLLGYSGEDTTVFVPDGVHTVARNAFNGLRNLFPDTAMFRLVLPEGVRTVESGAIRFENHLFEIVIPKSLTAIPEDAITSATCPKRVIYRGTRAEWEIIRESIHIPRLDTVQCTDGEI